MGESLGDGYIRIDADPGATFRLRAGFSGGGVWSPDFGAVVGVVVTADEHGNGEAVTLHQIDLCFPDEKLGELARWTASQAEEAALAAWGWRLDRDPEGVRHWRPRGRGVSGDSERGFRFRGRPAALTAITAWLDRAHADRRALVVTGSPGAGKSAVLGRIVTTADPDAAAALPPGDQAVRAMPGSVACAVHAKGKTALEVAAEIARAASAALPDQVEDFAPALRAALAGRDRRFNVIIDALDEATDPDQARTIITQVILPLTETCADAGAQVIAGTRRSTGEVDLLAAFGEAMRKLDLDTPRLFSQEDLAAYALATLRLEGDERDGNPYADEAAAGPVAARIAQLSGRNFLVAGLIARAHGLHDQHAVAPASLTFTASVDAAMRQYLQRLAPIADVPADAALTALAFAEAPGLPLELWQAAMQALGAGQLTTQQLARFARSPAASFLIESSVGPDNAVFRLFHQALNDALLHARKQIAVPADDQRALTRAFVTIGAQRGWDHAPSYLLRSLPAHAAAADMIDGLLADDTYLLHADLRRLIPLADHATTEAGRQRSRLLRLTPRAITARHATRTALFSVTETLDHLGYSYTTNSSSAPYRAVWAAATPHTERSVLEGHTSSVDAVCAFTLDGRTLLASGGLDRTVRIWDPATGTHHATLKGHTGWINAVCAFTLDGRTLLASGGLDRTVRIWDPATGTHHANLKGHTGRVNAVCAFTLDGLTLLASGTTRAIQIWNPATGTPHATLKGHTGPVNAVCAFTLDGRTLLASGSDDRAVRIWDPAAGTPQAALEGHTGPVNAVCAFTLDGRTLLASGSDDRAVRIWDPAAGTPHAALEGHTGWVNAVCAFTLDGRTLLASGGDDRAVRIWDPADRHPARGAGRPHRPGRCRVRLHPGRPDPAGQRQRRPRGADLGPGRRHAARGAGRPHRLGERRVRLHPGRPDPAGQRQRRPRRCGSGTRPPAASTRRRKATPARSMPCAPSPWTAGPCWPAAATTTRCGSGTRPTGTHHAALKGHTGRVNAVCAFTLDGRTLLASGGVDDTVRIWDPAAGSPHAALEGHTGPVDAVCAFTLDGRILLASGSDDDTVRIWDPAAGTHHAALKGHTGPVNAVCAFTLDGRTLIASGSDDDTVRIWDPAAGTHHAALKGHTGPVNAVCAFTLDGRTLLASGSDDRTIRIWDATTMTALLTVPVYHPVQAVDYAPDVLVIAVTAGLLAIRFNFAISKLWNVNSYDPLGICS